MIFTVDVEEWFTNGRNLTVESWDHFESRVETSTNNILDLLDYSNRKGTFFVLSWIALKKPDLIREIYNRGHEIASHGYAHTLVYTQSFSEFREDIRKSKTILEDVIGDRINGYRAPCFSITNWAYPILQEEGFSYSSSVVPRSIHPLYSRLEAGKVAYPYFKTDNNFLEFPLPVYKLGKVNIPWGGGGYFYYYPYFLYKYGMKKINYAENSFLFYIHPYEIDKEIHRKRTGLSLEKGREFRKLANSYEKLKMLLHDFDFTSIKNEYEHFITAY